MTRTSPQECISCKGFGGWYSFAEEYGMRTTLQNDEPDSTSPWVICSRCNGQGFFPLRTLDQSPPGVIPMKKHIYKVI